MTIKKEPKKRTCLNCRFFELDWEDEPYSYQQPICVHSESKDNDVKDKWDEMSCWRWRSNKKEAKP